MLGYTTQDLNNMKYGVDSALLVLDSDEHPAIHNYLVTASDFLGGRWAEGYFDYWITGLSMIMYVVIVMP